MILYYSQTTVFTLGCPPCFSTLWNYTTLKPRTIHIVKCDSFSTLWNYTTLKLIPVVLGLIISFSTLWNYTTLKQPDFNIFVILSFSTLWNYTTLKLLLYQLIKSWLSVPYEITLLSNGFRFCTSSLNLSVPYEITLLSNYWNGFLIHI